MKQTIKISIGPATELAEVLYNCEKYGFEFDISEYAYVIAELEYDNPARTIFKTAYEKEGE